MGAGVAGAGGVAVDQPAAAPADAGAEGEAGEAGAPLHVVGGLAGDAGAAPGQAGGGAADN